MGWLKKKPDPISERARALNEQIASLESQIKQLNTKLTPPPSGPRLRSTMLPHGVSPLPPASPPPAPPAARHEPIFEEVGEHRLKARDENGSTPEHYNELGVRKYDLAALFGRIKSRFQGPPTANPKLVSYLAAGSIQGLRPMRYEKRVARYRVLFFTFILLLVLVGLIAYVADRRR